MIVLALWTSSRFGTGAKLTNTAQLSPNPPSLSQHAQPQSQRKSPAGQCRRGDVEVVSRLLDVGHHQPRAAGCARWAEAFAAAHPLRDERTRRDAESQASQVR